MSIFSKLLNNLGYTKSDGGMMITDITGFSGTVYESEQTSDSAALKKYRNSLYVYTAMNYIATVFSSAEFSAYKVTNKKGDSEKMDFHPVLDILYKPNSIQTKSEFMRIVACNLKLAGETFIRIIRDERNQVIGMLNIRPDIVEVKIDSSTDAVTYIVNYPSGRKEFTTDEVFHIKTPDPDNPLRGTGVLTPIIGRVVAEERAVAVVNQALQSTRPDGIMFTKNATKEQADGLQAKLRQVFHPKSKDKFIVINDEDAKFQQISLTSDDIKALERLDFARDDIAMAFGVPKSLLTADDVNRANAESGLKQFMEFTIEPLLDQFEEALNERFINNNFAEPVYVEHDEMVGEDKTAVVDELSKSVNVWVTVNEARARMGYEPIEGGDVLKDTTATIAPIATMSAKSAFKGRPYLYKKYTIIENIRTAAERAVLKGLSDMNFFQIPQIRKAYMDTVHNALDKNIATMENESSAFFLTQGERLEKAYLEHDTGDMTFFDSTAEMELAKKSAMSAYRIMAKRSAKAGLSTIKMLVKEDTNFDLDTYADRELAARALMFAESTTMVTYDTVRKLIEDGVREGVGRDEQAKRLRQLFTDMSKSRAKRIAQTEGTLVSNLSLQSTFNKSDVVTGKLWLSSRDSKVRPEHLKNDSGVPVGKDEVFINGEAYPGQKSINCRCTIAPTFK